MFGVEVATGSTEDKVSGKVGVCVDEGSCWSLNCLTSGDAKQSTGALTGALPVSILLMHRASEIAGCPLVRPYRPYSFLLTGPGIVRCLLEALAAAAAEEVPVVADTRACEVVMVEEVTLPPPLTKEADGGGALMDMVVECRKAVTSASVGATATGANTDERGEGAAGRVESFDGGCLVRFLKMNDCAGGKSVGEGVGRDRGTGLGRRE